MDSGQVTLGIVGHEALKFTAASERMARQTIRDLIQRQQATKVVSGACHLGGIDEWAIEEAEKLGLQTREFPPKTRTWTHYRERNIQIAEAADLVVSIVVDKLPASFTGPRWEYCYHCHTDAHVKSGGCWTAKYARERLGKRALVVVLCT